MRRSPRGFTLIELMIVVAIIGILAAIAVPNFVKFTARARQTEVKSNLKGYSTAARSYFAEQATYACGSCSFEPEQGTRYQYNLGGTVVDLRANKADTCTAPTGSATATTFLGGGGANIDSDATCDKWTIDEKNVLTNTSNDVDT